MQFLGIQYLRGLAASMVVVFHAAELLRQSGEHSYWPNYVFATGVDIFFVLSGFLMIYITSSDSNAGRFIVNRLARIGPLYWIISGVLSVLILAKPELSSRPIDVDVVIKSLMFIPSYLGDNTIQTTVVSVGWTLVYEMFFYFVFTAVLASGLPRFSLIFVLAILVVVRFYSANFYMLTYGNPIILEFAMGMLIAKLPVINESRSKLLLMFGFFFMLVGCYLDGQNMEFRPLSCGLGAGMMVYGAIYVNPLRYLIPLVIGDASYSIYLTHIYSIKYIGFKILPHSVIALTVLAIVFGVIVYLLIERPVTRRVQVFSRKFF